MLARRLFAVATAAILTIGSSNAAPIPEDTTPLTAVPADDPAQDTQPSDRIQALRDRYGDFQGEDFKQNLLRDSQLQFSRYSSQIGEGDHASETPKWRSIGPRGARYETNFVTLDVSDSGRVRNILQDPKRLDTVYVLTSGGGLWKTRNFSDNHPRWEPKTDRLLSTSGGAVDFGRTANTLYLGIGDPFDGFPSLSGVMTKSHDGGETWGPLVSLPGAGSVRDVKTIVWGSTDIVLVATDIGLYRSTDAGDTFSLVASVPGQGFWSIVHTSAGWLATSSVFGTGSPTPGLLLRSTDQGATWTTVPGLAGIGRTTLAVGQAGDVVVYAFAARPDGQRQLDLFKSIDGGLTWVALNVNGSRAPVNPNADQPDLDVMWIQAWYNQAILVDPNDLSRNTIFLGGELASIRSTDGGKNWTVISDWLPSADPSTTGLPYVHADFHAATAIKLETDDDDDRGRGGARKSRNGIMFGTDGGIFLSTDGGATFSFEKNDGIVAFLSQTVITPPTAMDRILTGMQDDGTRARLRSSKIFNQVTGGDGEGVGWSQANNAITMSSVPGGIYWSPGLSSDTIGTWHRFGFAQPLFFTPVATPTASADPSGLIFLSANQLGVVVTFDGGSSWFYLARSGSRLPSNWTTRDVWFGLGLDPSSNFIKISAAGTGGRVAITVDGGITWTVRNLISQVPGFQGFISTSLWTANGTLYVASESPIAGSIRVLRSDDGLGLGWSRRDNGLPDAPIYNLAVDPSDASGNTLYAGTYIGVFRTTDGGLNWSLFGAGLPAVRANGLWVSPDGKLVRAATYGRGIWEISPYEKDRDVEVADR